MELFHADERAHARPPRPPDRRHRGRPRRGPQPPGDEREQVVADLTTPSTACSRRRRSSGRRRLRGRHHSGRRRRDRAGRRAPPSRRPRSSRRRSTCRRRGPPARSSCGRGVAGRAPENVRRAVDAARGDRRSAAGLAGPPERQAARRSPGRRTVDPDEGRARLARARQPQRPDRGRRQRRCGSPGSRSKASGSRDDRVDRADAAPRAISRRTRIADVVGALEAGARRPPADPRPSPRRCRAPSPRSAATTAARRSRPCIAASGRGDRLGGRRADGVARRTAERQHRSTTSARRSIARMDGIAVPAPATVATTVGPDLDQWTRTVTSPSRPRLVVQLVAARLRWRVARSPCTLPARRASSCRSTPRCAPSAAARHVADEWARLDRIFPALGRAGVRRRGQVALSQDEAWEFMTRVGPDARGRRLRRAGAEAVAAQAGAVAAPVRRGATGSVVGAHQLSNVAWSVLFDDVELTAEEVARLAKQARPLVQSQGRWVELDRSTSSRRQRRSPSASPSRSSPAPRSSATASASTRRVCAAASSSRATAGRARSCAMPQAASTEPVTAPEGFVGELRTYQAEALGWIAFLEAAELGGCLALDMGLGKTPTVLAHLARSAGDGAGARHRTGGRRRQLGGRGGAVHAASCACVVHHGATRASADAARDGDQAAPTSSSPPTRPRSATSRR